MFFFLGRVRLKLGGGPFGGYEQGTLAETKSEPVVLAPCISVPVLVTDLGIQGVLNGYLCSFSSKTKLLFLRAQQGLTVVLWLYIIAA